MEKTIQLWVPEGTEWPVVGRDLDTGWVKLLPGFLEAVADASGLSLSWYGNKTLPVLTTEMVSELLVRWYIERRKSGFPSCPIMEGLIKEEFGAQLFIPIDKREIDH